MCSDVREVNWKKGGSQLALHLMSQVGESDCAVLIDLLWDSWKKKYFRRDLRPMALEQRKVPGNELLHCDRYSHYDSVVV
jgi:hypothetical protein